MCRTAATHLIPRDITTGIMHSISSGIRSARTAMRSSDGWKSGFSVSKTGLNTGKSLDQKSTNAFRSQAVLVYRWITGITNSHLIFSKNYKKTVSYMTYPVVLPYYDAGGEGPPAHFAHANGYPPRAYRQLLQGIAKNNHVIAMHMRPLWPGSDPRSISDWRPLADDLERFLDQQNLSDLVGWGHSMGATTTLRLALHQPERFRALILIDPVFFGPAFIRLWDVMYRLGLGYRVHPLVKGALKRRSQFESRETMFTNYRKKAVFSRMNDTALHDYVEAVGCPREDGHVELCYPVSWEARIYATSARADLELWQMMPRLKIPLLILRGSESDTFWESTGRRMQRCLPSAAIYTITNASHLVALEKPDEILTIANEFLGSLPHLT